MLSTIDFKAKKTENCKLQTKPGINLTFEDYLHS